jgi:hypothetical protein
LSAVVGALACTGDPTGDLRNGIDHLVANPSSLFLDQEATGRVVIEGVDEQGNRLAIQPVLVGAANGIQVEKDESFNLVFDQNGQLVQPSRATRVRYNIEAGTLPVDASFEVKAGGKSITIPVRVLPTKFVGTFSNATPAIGDTVTVSVTAPIKIRPDAKVSAGGADAVITDIAADGRSVSFIPYPGGDTGPLTIDGLSLDFSPGLKLTVPSASDLTLPPAYEGTDTPATAPAIPLPAAGAAETILDAGAFAASPACNNNIGDTCRYYKLVFGATTTLTVSLTWDTTGDVGGYFTDATGADLFGDFACDSHASGATGQPETCTETFAPGTYYLGLAYFTDPNNPEPGHVRIDISAQ